MLVCLVHEFHPSTGGHIDKKLSGAVQVLFSGVKFHLVL